MEKKYTAAIFDLDGTLLDTLEDLQASVNHTMHMLGFPERTLDEIRIFLGNGVRNLLKLSMPDGQPDSVHNQAYQIFRAYYKEHCNDKTKPYPGVIDLLKKLKEQGIKTAVVSNKADFAVKELERIYFQDIVDVSVGQNSGIPRKPAPDMVLLALKELSAVKEDVVYIGDSEVDMATAKNAGIPCISVSWGFRTEEFLWQQGAERVVNTAGELERILI